MSPTPKQVLPSFDFPSWREMSLYQKFVAIWLSIHLFFWLMLNWHPLQLMREQIFGLWFDVIFTVLFFGSVTIIIYAISQTKFVSGMISRFFSDREASTNAIEDIFETTEDDTLELENEVDIPEVAETESEEEELFFTHGWWWTVFFGILSIFLSAAFSEWVRN